MSKDKIEVFIADREFQGRQLAARCGPCSAGRAAFFQVTGVLLIVFATGLMAHGIHEFQETGLLPIPVEHVWDINYLPAV